MKNKSIGEPYKLRWKKVLACENKSSVDIIILSMFKRSLTVLVPVLIVIQTHRHHCTFNITRWYIGTKMPAEFRT